MAEPAAITTTPPTTGRMRWYALGLLSTAYALHSLDRAIISVLVEPIKNELHVSDGQMGILAGLAHAVAFAAATVPLGYLIDRVSRVRLLAILLMLWSGFTALCFLASGFASLLWLRLCVGASEAGGAPACLSLISDLFARRERATAIGMLYLSPAFGTAASFLIGGLVAASYGWRAAFLIAGLPGLLLAILMIATMREPARTRDEADTLSADEPQKSGVFDALRFVIGSPVMRQLVCAVALSALVMTSVWTWMASLLIRLHGLTIAEAGIIIAIAAGGCQGAGSAISGKLADRVSGGVLHRLCIVPILCALLSVPLGLITVTSTATPVAIAALMLLAFVFTGWLAPTYSIALGMAPPKQRGSTMAVVQLATILIGSGIGPYMVGVLSDRIGGAASIRWALAITICFNLWAALHFWWLKRLLYRRTA